MFYIKARISKYLLMKAFTANDTTRYNPKLPKYTNYTITITTYEKTKTRHSR